MDNALTIRDVAIMTGLHRNTIRNYVKAGRLKATLIDEGTGRQRYVIDREALYNCGIPKVLSHLGPLEVQERLNKSQAEYTDDTFGELIRLNRELLAAREELSGLRVQVPMLQAAQVERDSLREERDRLAQERAGLEAKASVLEAALNEARADMKWSARRRMSKAGKVQSG
jgi:hypothetical protein